MTKEDILEIFNKNTETAKLGSDGEYETIRCIYSEDYVSIAETISELWQSENLKEIEAKNKRIAELEAGFTSFGNYLLSDRRKQLFQESYDQAIQDGQNPVPVDEAMKGVWHSDIENWKAEIDNEK